MLIDLKRQTQRPTDVDLREFFTEVHNQKALRSSTAFSCADLLQYFERRALGLLFEPSTLFIYHTSRRLSGLAGDSGCPLRWTWKAIKQFGVPKEDHWPYTLAMADAEPDAFAYSSARHYHELRYLRLDPRGQRGERTLDIVKAYLAAGFPCVFGFPVSRALVQQAEIPLPNIYDVIHGGQSVIAVGFDDHRKFRSYRGALLIRNSWGKDWGEDGYGWLPYAYVREELAADFWTVLEPQWLESGEFLRPYIR